MEATTHTTNVMKKMAFHITISELSEPSFNFMTHDYINIIIMSVNAINLLCGVLQNSIPHSILYDHENLPYFFPT